MVKPVVEKSVKQSYPVSTAALQELGNCPDAYQQALDDFGINDLLSHLSNYSDADFSAALMNLEEQELESLATSSQQHRLGDCDWTLLCLCPTSVPLGNLLPHLA